MATVPAVCVGSSGEWTKDAALRCNDRLAVIGFAVMRPWTKRLWLVCISRTPHLGLYSASARCVSVSTCVCVCVSGVLHSPDTALKIRTARCQTGSGRLVVHPSTMRQTIRGGTERLVKMRLQQRSAD